MHVNHATNRWMSGAILALAVLCATGAAHASDGRMTITGAVVAPTCGVDDGNVRQASQAAGHAVQVSCAATRNDPRDSSAYQLKVTQLGGATVDPRVKTYFGQFSPDAGAMVAVQTYR